MERNGIRRYIASANYIWRPNTAWVRIVSVEARPLFTTDLSNRLVEEDHDVPFVTLTTPALDQVGAGYTFQRDLVDEAFEILPGLTLPPHNYSYSLFQGFIQTSEARPVSASFNLRLGDYYSGTRSGYRGAIDWRPSRFLTAGASYELREIRLAQGDFDVRIVGARLNLAFTPNLTWNTLLQYDNVSRQVGVNSRIRWTWRPGDDLFLVFNQGWDYDAGRLINSNSEVTIKAAAAFRF